jgi:4-amino-4-deoxy-L-arabinose transferase-like glycosyltransferase
MEYAPLPAYLMAILYRVFSPDVLVYRWFNILVGTASCLLVYCIASRLVTRRYALLALAGAVICPPLIFYSLVPLKTALAVLLFGLVVYLTVSVHGKSSLLRILLLGLSLGFFCNVRPNGIVFLPILPFLLFLLGIKELGIQKRTALLPLVFLLGFLVAVAPFLLRSHHLEGSLHLLPAQSGFLLYANNNPANPTPYYRPVAFASSHPREQGIQFTIEAQRQSGQKKSLREASAFWRQQVLEMMMSSPVSFFKKLGHKALASINFHLEGDHYHLRFMAELMVILQLPLPGWPLFLVLGLSGLLFALAKGDSPAKRCNLLVWPYILTLVIYSPGTRFQLPLLMIFIPAALYYVHILVTKARKKQIGTATSLLLLPILFSCIALLPLQGVGEKSNSFNTHAFLLKKNGQVDKATQYWQRAEGLNESFSDISRLFLAGVSSREGDLNQAIRYLERIADSSFAAAAKYATLGDILRHKGLTDEAIEAYNTSLAINYGQRRIRRLLVRMLHELAPKEAARQQEILLKINAYY